MTIPFRSFEKGRQVSDDMMRMASQPFIAPKVMLASAPPVTAQVTLPLRTIWNAWPMACVADAQADETAKVGPLMPQYNETWLAGALIMALGMVRGCRRAAPSE
jgi:hypothetical protein